MEAKGQNEAEGCNTAPQTKDLDLPLLNLATVEGGFGPVYKIKQEHQLHQDSRLRIIHRDLSQSK